MKIDQIRPHQIKAINAITTAINNEQRHITVEMETGTGVSLVMAKTVDYLLSLMDQKILIITNSVSTREHINNILFHEYENLININKESIDIKTAQYVTKHADEINERYKYVIVFNVPVTNRCYDFIYGKGKTIIVFQGYVKTLFKTDDTVFTYSYQDAVKDGILTPAMDSKAFAPTVELFVKRLLEQFDCIPTGFYPNTQDQGWDMIFQKDEHKIWVVCKTYKSQVVSPTVANSLLNSIVLQKMKQDILENDVVLLVVLSKIPSFQKEEIFKRYRIIVWDIENLVYYSKNEPSLLKQLSQITYFPIDYIKGQPFGEEKLYRIFLESSQEQILENKIVVETKKEADKTVELIQRLNDCKSGKKHSSKYENICEEILRTLFEANYFNKLRNQYKTKDEYFRMDLIGSLKINQNNEEGMHPFWQMLVQHYNSHFVVFEFKNYSKEIDQNLIYITEKYLFDAALRNVAIIISRKGFSKSAKFAAEGCLKEHGKLILDVTNDDLIKMLELGSGQATDYLLEKLEKFLMGISK